MSSLNMRHLSSEEVLYTRMFQYLRVQDVVRLSAFDGISDLLDAAAIEAFDGGGRDAGIVVGTDDAGIAFVDGATVVDGIIDDVVEELVLANGAVDVCVIDQVSS